jgi:hypothetical protein
LLGYAHLAADPSFLQEVIRPCPSLVGEGRGLGRVKIRNFHKWCSDLLWQHCIPKPSSNKFKGDAYWDEIIRRVLEAVQLGRIPAGQFGAVMIDEGHDFKPAWYQLVVQMVDPDTDSLPLVHEDGPGSGAAVWHQHRATASGFDVNFG